VNVEDGKIWLSEFGAKDAGAERRHAVAVMGPMKLPPAKSYTAVLSYAVMRPGGQFAYSHACGAEAWYVIAGEQCLETSAGVLAAQGRPRRRGRVRHSDAAARDGLDDPPLLRSRDPRWRATRGSPSDWKAPGRLPMKMGTDLF